MKSRRHFLKNTIAGAAGIAAASALASCSSFDDYLFEDNFSFNDEVLIVGGGIAGLYLAYKLRNSHSEFRLFEAGNVFGGRIKSSGNVDFGASVLSVNDKLSGQLVNDFKLQKTSLDKETYFLNDGMGGIVTQLQERILGLLPYRNFRLRWKLIEINKTTRGYDLVFENPNGVKRFTCRKLALAIPPSQWRSIRGLLELPEMNWAEEWLQTLQTENSLRLILPASALPASAKNYVISEHDNLSFRQVVKKGKFTSHAELDIRTKSDTAVSIDYIYGVLKKKLQINYPFQTLPSDQYFDWHDAKFIQGAAFKNSKPVASSQTSNFQILGDFTSSLGATRIEGALLSAQKASERFL